jgi:hypothetical protein
MIFLDADDACALHAANLWNGGARGRYSFLDSTARLRGSTNLPALPAGSPAA